MSHLWSGRFAVEPDASVFEFGKSLSVDRRLVDDDLTGSQAWARAQRSRAMEPRGLAP